MKCPVCVAEGLTSRVYPGSGATTLMAHSTYYDEGGVYHSHDPNTTSTRYECSNGHRWGETRTAKCPAGDYGGERKVVVR